MGGSRIGNLDGNARPREQVTGFREIRIPYKPLPSQRKFHNSEARFKGFSGPIGSGKSQALCQEAIRLSYMNPGRTGLIGAPTYPMLRDATVAALIEALGRNGIGYELNRAENFLTIGAIKSRILFRAVEEFERLRGSNLAWFGVDELTYTSQDAWLRLEGRLRDPLAKRLCGFAVWTPKGYDWVYDKFIASPVKGYETVIASAFENRFLLKQIPDYYERLRDSYDERFYQQEVLGQYLNLHAGRVYTAFDRRTNVAGGKLDPYLPLEWALDFNVDPMSSVIGQVKGDTLVILDEIVLRRATTQEACEEFERRYPHHAAGLNVYADASGNNMQTTGETDVNIIKAFFRRGEWGEMNLRIPRSNPAVQARVLLMNARLCSADGKRTILIDERCKELIKDFEQVSYKEGSGAIDKDKDPRRTHTSDALGYLVWQHWGQKQTVGEQGRPLLPF